ncbi:hypothetical protein KC315_g1069 [Hortaea werneckii]|nr:hypothetical protein KC315_g1069 [Hortaea werneckii]KAI7370575.1 hypothetical protein KC354_g1156 [Hortaea werneckii]
MANTSSTSANTPVGHICRVTHSHRREIPKQYRSQAFPDAFLDVKKNELGEITGRVREQPASYVRLHDRPGKPVIFILNLYLEISTARWDQDWDFGYNLSTTNQLKPVDDLASPQYGNPSGLELHILGFLSGVRDNYNRIPNLDKYQQHLKTPQDARTTAYRMSNGIVPRVKAVMQRPDFTLQDVLDAGEEFGSYRDEDNNYKGITDRRTYLGIYLIVYWDFPPDSQYHGKVPYIGQSNNMAHRGYQHRFNAFSEKIMDYNSEHYKCAREARKWKTVRLLVQQDHQEGGSDIAASDLRDIYENTFFLLLRTYHPRACDPKTLPTSGKGNSPEKSLPANMTYLTLGHLYTSIANESFAATGYADPATRTTFQSAPGLNVSSPMDGIREQWERTPICSQYLPDDKRRVFHMPQRIAISSDKVYNGVYIYTKDYFDDNGVKKRMALSWRGPKSSLKAGDEIYVSWELMNQGYEHPAPVFPMGRIGCWSNWHEIARLGLKVTFRRAGSPKWYAMYVQYSALWKSPMAEGVEGATRPYAFGTAMLAFLQGTYWGHKEPWIPYFGRPNMVEVQVNRFHKHIFCKPVTASAPLPNITYQPQSAAHLLSTLRVKDNNGAVVGQEKLQNVGGPFGQFDTTWVSGSARSAYMRRKRCDRDFLGHLSDQVDFSIEINKVSSMCKPKVDAQGQDTDQCVPCFLRGLPCTWTRPDWVGGRNWRNVTATTPKKDERSSRTFSGRFWDKYYESVFGKLTPKEALEPKEVPDPGYVRIQASEGNVKEDEWDTEVDEFEA